MKCPHCGEELPEGFVYIPVGQEDEIQEDTAPAAESAEELTEPEAAGSDIQDLPIGQAYPIMQTAAADVHAPSKHYSRRLITLLLAAAVIIAGTLTGFGMYGRASLKSKMTGTWASAGSIMTTGKLTVTEDTISYSETFGFMEMNGQTAPYKAVSKDTVEIQGIRHKISFDASESTMTITPGITTNGAEIWYSTSMQSIPGQSGEQSGGDNQRGTDSSDGML